MTKIKIFEENGEKFYPQTHIKAILGLETATEENNGLMSKEDKIKLNNLNETGANNHKLGSIFYKEVNIDVDHKD